MGPSPSPGRELPGRRSARALTAARDRAAPGFENNASTSFKRTTESACGTCPHHNFMEEYIHSCHQNIVKTWPRGGDDPPLQSICDTCRQNLQKNPSSVPRVGPSSSLGRELTGRRSARALAAARDRAAQGFGNNTSKCLQRSTESASGTCPHHHFMEATLHS